MSSTAASRYADYETACPRSQQIIETIDITFQQGIFIYDLTFIQQELESVLIGAIERQNQLRETKGDDLKLPMSSMVQLVNGKKPRDFKAERERRRKAFNGHPSRKRRMKKSSTINFLKNLKQEKNGHSTENRACRTMASPAEKQPAPRNGHFTINQIFNPDQFWSKIVNLQQEYLKKSDWNDLEKLIEIDQSLLENVDHANARDLINSKEYLLSDPKYVHPELESSIVIKRNTHFHRFIDRLSNNHRFKRKSSSVIENDSGMDIDHSIFQYFQRDAPSFPSKYAELQYRLQESLQLERLALARAQRQTKLDDIRLQLSEIDEKILEITNSIRQRKRPSENAISLSKTLSPTPVHSSNEDDAWRKGRRQSTLRIYDELARLIDERLEYDKQLGDVTPTVKGDA